MKTPYTISELTRESAEAGGHIAWVEESDPAKAITAMFNGISRKPFNASVWANAATMPSEDRLLLNEWRERYYFRDRTCGIVRVNLAAADRERQLSKLFDRFASLPRSKREFATVHARVNSILKNHLSARLNALASALPSKSLSVDLRASRDIKTLNPHPPHIDGQDYDLRFIESLVGPDTLLADMESGSGQNTCRYWQPPAGSLILLTTESHPWEAIAHASPFTPENCEKPISRAVVVYDTDLPRKRRFFWG